MQTTKRAPHAPERFSRDRTRFRDRRDAGRLLALLLDRYRLPARTVVLGIPRGGVPVAFEVALHLHAPLDVFVARKLGVPGHEELAMGAIAGGGVVVLDEDSIRALGVPTEVVRRVAEEQSRELTRRERRYRGGQPPLDVSGENVILVDDGMATGSSMRAAVEALRRLGPNRIIVAIPTAPLESCIGLTGLVDDVVCAMNPSPFFAVGDSYNDFTQTTDEEVRALLGTAARRSARSEG